ncbi:MAG: hypothetical protein ABIJ96_08400 [Elusimicrobiota bacterium]
MPDLSTILKSEITRLARRAIHPINAALKKDVAWLKHQAAAHRRQIAQLRHDNQRLMTDLNEKLKAPPKATEDEMKHARISPRVIRAQRKRLGLSRENFGKLLRVSGQSVLVWEGGKAKPREAARAALVAIRKLGKREARERLQVIGTANGSPVGRAAKKKKRRGKRR